MLEGQCCCTSPGCGLGNVSRGPSLGAAVSPETANAAAGGGGLGFLVNAAGLAQADWIAYPVAGTAILTPCRYSDGPCRLRERYHDIPRVASGMGAAFSLPHQRVSSSLALYPYVLAGLLEGQEPRREPDVWRVLLIIRCGDVHLNPGPARKKELLRMGSVTDTECYPLMSFKGWHRHRPGSPKRLSGGFANVRTMLIGSDVANTGGIVSLGSEVTATGDIVSWGFEKLELLKYRMQDSNLYFLAMAETRMEGSGQLDCGDGFVLLYHNAEGKKGHGGVAIMLSPVAHFAWSKGGEHSFCHPSGRVMSCSFLLGGKEGLWHVLSGYGPANSRRRPAAVVERERVEYFQALDDTIKKVTLAGDFYIIAADMNCRVGFRAAAEDGFRATLGCYGMGRRNAAGQVMLDFCTERRLAVGNSFFQHKSSHTATWYHPCFKIPAVLDYMLVGERHFGHVEDVRAFPGLDIASDHALVILRLVARPQGGVSRWSHVCKARRQITSH